MDDIIEDLAPNLSSTETDTDDFVAVLDEMLDGEAKKRAKNSTRGNQ